MILNFPFHISIDASKYALGCTLSQDTGTCLRPIAFESRKLNSAEQNYGIYDRESLALVHAAVKTWRHYIDVCKCYVDTDHATLKYILTQGQIGNSRQARWMKIFQKTYMILNFLTNQARQIHLTHSAEDQISCVLLSLQFLHLYLLNLLQLTLQIHSFPVLPLLLILLTHSSLLLGSRNLEFAFLIVQNLKLTLLREHHDSITSGHFSTYKTLNLLSRTFTWNGMARDVRSYVRSCDTCQRAKPCTQVPAGLLQSLPILDQKWESISLDFIVGLP